MKICNVVLSTEPSGGKGGVATVIPMYIEALGKLGATEFIPTHNGHGIAGKIWPWILSFQRSIEVLSKNPGDRVIFHLHPGSGFCIFRMLTLAIFLRFIVRRRVFIYLHTPYLEQYLDDLVWSRIIRSLVNCSDRVIVLTSYAFRLLEKHGLHLNVHVVPNPFEPKNAEARKRVSHSDIVTVLVMGRLVEGKGFMETLNAMRHLSDRYRLVIAGDGELKEQLCDAIAHFGLERRIVMKGWVFAEAKEELLRSADVFCLPSRVDSFGMSFVEAQAYDLPIVAYSHPPVVEVVRADGGVFVSSLDPSVIAKAIERANDLNSKIPSGSGRDWVIAKFGIDRTSQQLADIIQDVV
jgi:glycosyltransferase involved in cell wall biosynthesis